MKYFRACFMALLISACSHLTNDSKRQTASTPQPLKITGQEELLPFPALTCPPGTDLAFGEVKVNVESCLKKYIHKETQHGVTREKTCFPPSTSHERSLLIPPQGKIYAAVLRAIHYPTRHADIFVTLQLNHAYYSLELSGEASLSAKEVKHLFREAALPQKVRLERCVCDITQNGEQNCLEKLSPLLQHTFQYGIELITPPGS